jgi:serralysin
MLSLEHVSTVYGGGLDQPSQSVSITLLSGGDYPRISVTDFGFGEAREFTLTQAGLGFDGLRILDVAPTVSLDIAGYGYGEVELVTWNAAALSSNTAGSLWLDIDGGGGFMDAANLIVVTGPNSEEIVFVAAENGYGLTGFLLDGVGSVVGRQVTQDTSTHYLGGVADMAAVHLDDQTFLYAASSFEHGISGWLVGATSALQSVVQLGPNESLPIHTPTAIVSGQSGQNHFVVAAAAGSSSLSVMRVGSDGALSVTDHMVDNFDSRFAAVTHLEAVTYDGRMYILAAGADHGLSLFGVTAEGRLIHFDSLPDSLTFALGGVSGLLGVVRFGGLDVLTTASDDAGLSMFRVDLPSGGIVETSVSGSLSGTAGDDMLSLRTGAGWIEGGAGNDIISDGFGSDSLTGGTGQDVFVLRADGLPDIITDIDVTEDRLDLSAWTMLRNADQFQFEETAEGMIVYFGEEVLELRNVDQLPITAEQVTDMWMRGPSHYEVEIGSLIGPDPEQPSDPAGRVIGTPLPDRLETGSGNDYVHGMEGNDTILGGSGHDGLLGGLGDDLIFGGAGDDNIPGKEGNDTLYGENGNDQLGGSDGFDLIFGGAGHDVAGGGSQNDTMYAGDGNDWFSGGWGNDYVSGGEGHDKLAGSYDNDTVLGGAGDDSLGGGWGNDLMYGGVGNDIVGAGQNNDTVYGEQGDDSLGGGDGNDQLLGGEGNDTLNGAHGDDHLTGASGADQFLFNNYSSSGVDVVSDFEQGIDVLRLLGVHLGPAAGRLDALDPTNGAHGGQTGAWIEFGAHDIFLQNIEAATLTLDDFVFV